MTTKRFDYVGEIAVSDKPIVGVDVSKDWLDLCWHDKLERIANNAEAIVAWLDRIDPGLVGCEPTGGYERVLLRALRERGITFVRVHPNQVVAFRKSRGIRAKTDRIDAQLILAFVTDLAARRALRPGVMGHEGLRELVARRAQLIDNLQAERCRLPLAAGASVRRSLDTMIAALEASLAAIEDEIAVTIADDPGLAEVSRLLQTIFGVGRIVAATLLADLPELGLLSGKEIAALVGLAPGTRQSGKTRYRETIGHGRPGVRRVLFNAARSAIAHPSPFRAFYDRLVNTHNRPGKVALIAVMRKILVTANAVTRDRQPWRGEAPPTVGTPCRPHGEPTIHRAGRVKAAAAPRAVARSASLDAA